MPKLSISRRTLFVSSAAALAAPAILSRASFAQEAEQEPVIVSPETRSFTIGKFAVSTVRDGKVVAEKPHETFGTNQKPEDVAAALEANMLPSDKFINSFAPTLVDTGTDVILFDTGFGEGGRANGNGQLLSGLQSLGYEPGQISVVVLTHMHGDHIGGLMEGGKPAFANARYVTGRTEYDFWVNPERMGTPAEQSHQNVLAKVQPLAEKLTFIEDEGEVVPGIRGLNAFGHSPGHMIFRVESEGRALILTADTANHFVLSLQRPDWEVRFDMDKAQAAATRKKVFDMIATDRLAFVGYHMPFPAAGFVEKAGEGYRFVPVSYQFDV